MGWELKGKPQTVKVTNKLAKEWAEMDAAHTDRPLSERRLQVYEKVLADDAFRPVTWAKVYCKETGAWVRVNGKHTSTLFSSADLKGKELYVTIEEYECDALDDVAKLYATFDSRQMVRTTSDINRSFAAVIPELAGIGANTIDVAVSGMAWHFFPTTPTKEPSAEKAERLFEYSPFVLWLQDVLVGGDTDVAVRLRRAPVVGAMMGGYMKSKSAATEFWKSVRDGTDPSPKSPSRKLQMFLTMKAIDRATGSHRPDRLKGSQREFYVRCVHAWNAWRRGENTELRYYADAKLPTCV